MDIVTYALLKKRITSALSGVKDIDLINNQTILFTTNDGKEFKIKIPTPDLVYVGDEAPPKDSEYELWVDTSDSGTTPLNRAILSEDIVASTIIGSVTSGKVYEVGTSLEQVIRDILTSYSKPTVTITINPTKDIYDVVEDKLEKITTNAKVVKGTKSIKSITFYVDAMEDKVITEGVSAGGNFSNSHTFDPSINKTFTLKVTVDDGEGRVTATKTVTFIGKSYWGYLPEAVTKVTEDDVKSLQNKTLKNSRSLTYADIPIPQDGELYKICYCYPKELSALTKIVDSNGFNYFDSYEKQEVEVDGHPYNCYIMIDGSGADGATHIYS